MHLHTRNVNTAFRGLVGLFAGKPWANNPFTERANPVVRRPSRNGDVLVIDEPVTITYSHPRERVLFNPARDLNPFAFLYHSLWLLAGRNDLAPLTYYLRRMADYSDDGETLNGAYGYRWRRHTNWEKCAEYMTAGSEPVEERVDQLDVLVEHLKADPTSRRAVLQMWTVEGDLLKVGPRPDPRTLPRHDCSGLVSCGVCRGGFSKDVCCNLSVLFSLRDDPTTLYDDEGPLRYLDMTVTNRSNDLCMAGETRFRSPEGSTCIAELAERFSKKPGYKFPVYSVDTKTGEQRLSWMTRAWKSGIKPVIRVGFDDGSFVRFTADHVVYKKTKTFQGKRCTGLRIDEAEVRTLKVGDRLLADIPETAKCRIGTGYIGFKKNLFRNTSFSNIADEHRAYWEFVTGDELGADDVHHRDENKSNNTFSNLRRMTRSEHRSYHLKKSNPNDKMTPEQVFARASKGGKTRKGRKHTEAARKAMARAAKVRDMEGRRGRDGLGRYASNHRVISIEPDGVTDVYDFTVPGDHNAVLANGVLTHNCWGMLGEDYLTFSVLQEYMATRLGVGIGRYHHFSNNLHVYTDTNSGFKPDEWLAPTDNGIDADHYRRAVTRNGETYTPGWTYAWHPMTTVPLVRDPAAFERELPGWAETYGGEHFRTDGGCECPQEVWTEPFLQAAGLMMLAYRDHKRGRHDNKYRLLDMVKADDWRLACTAWLKRRAK